MDNAFRYWQLVCLDGSGRCRYQVLTPVQTWLKATFADWITDPTNADTPLQSQLLAVWQAGGGQAHLAELSLRCWLSHQIRLVCVHLVKQFGDRHGLVMEDLLPYVLDDDGRSHATYTPLTLEILQSYDPTKAKLSTWATRLTKNHPDLNRVLLEKNLYRVSDWAILNDTSPEQLRRVLGQYHLCSPAEIEAAHQLIHRYHRVYRRQRLEQRQAGKASGRCQPPTPEQLQQMSGSADPKRTLAQLKALAAQLRQYRIHARGGNPALYGSEEVDWDRLPADPASATPGPDHGPTAFLQAYRQELHRCLDQVLAQAIRTYMATLAKRQPPKDRLYLLGLERFHCQGQSMGAIAADLGLTNQVQVTRLLQLKRLREEVQALLIPLLQQRVNALAQQYVSVADLQQRREALDQMLAQTVEEVIGEATSEAQIPQGRTAKSLFAQTLCKTLHPFLAPIQPSQSR